MKRAWWIAGALLTLAAVAGLSVYYAGASTRLTTRAVPRAASPYVVLAWNNLGMHCYNPDFSNLAVLPPYNTLYAQVIKVGDPPQIVTSGVTVEYAFPDNTYSVGVRGRADKTNFWSYAQSLFHLATPLPPNVGLTGKMLSGTMDVSGDHFVAEGIPLTEFRDQDAVNKSPYPFQKAVVTVKDATAPSKVLARLTVVAPVSTELNCANCHSDDGDATTGYPITPTGNVDQNILTLHDYLNADNYQTLGLTASTPLMDHRPVLCADCHSSNALGTSGASGVLSLSNAMHLHHKDLPDITPDTDGCYNCHPGPRTQCLRDTMSQDFSANCTNCHGAMATVAQNPSPWLIEPKCSAGACHGAAYDTSQALYRESEGHGGVYCAGCHDSPHAIGPSREANDTIKFMELQGHAGALRDCSVCHTGTPTDIFKHGK